MFNPSRTRNALRKFLRFGGFASRLPSLGSRGYLETIDHLERQLQERDALISSQAAALAHSRKIFDRASVSAQIGVWECSLPDETLHWTDVVYDLFDLPRGSVIDRSEIVECYSPESARELKLRRDRAIEERSGFTMDAEIITRNGNRKWIRLTASVECEDDVPVRIFGMKQDITEEKIMLDRTRYLAEFDLMTGLANRSQFLTRLSSFCDHHGERKSLAALLLVDLDGFKAVNDSMGHAAGDECLKEAASRLRSVCGDGGFVARIGGDEFAALMGPCTDRGSIAEMARDIIGSLSRPVDYYGRTLTLGASVGIAIVDGSVPSELSRRADIALYAAKGAGRGTFRFYKPEQEPAISNPRDAA
ncbi:diguanylate cyclase [Neorhizobium sp. P12A]|uniref:diguanylate cyclase domain-containing protein n=1 Tax=Neorhizobium sp. P12A TaxID=2268027 RepID=UPI0011EC18F3|nr:diguanylate cyclase [Neorhizobium sp. P12A]KAA0697659.1 diguanylate cyclase [Neorhizobium sp. P12A]